MAIYGPSGSDVFTINVVLLVTSVIGTVLSVVGTIFVVLRRSYFPFNRRHVFSIVLLHALLPLIAYVGVIANVLGVACGFYAVAQSLCGILIGIQYSARGVSLLFHFKITENITAIKSGNQELGFYLRHRVWGTYRTLSIIAAIDGAVGTVLLIASFFIFSTLRQSGPCYGGAEAFWLLRNAYVGIHCVVCAVLGWTMRKFKDDALLMKAELRVAGYVSIVLLAIYLILSLAISTTSQVFNVGTLMTVILLITFTLISVWYPLARSFAVDSRERKVDLVSFLTGSQEDWDSFFSFLEREFSTENLLFWSHVQRLRARYVNWLELQEKEREKEKDNWLQDDLLVPVVEKVQTEQDQSQPRLSTNNNNNNNNSNNNSNNNHSGHGLNIFRRGSNNSNNNNNSNNSGRSNVNANANVNVNDGGGGDGSGGAGANSGSGDSGSGGAGESGGGGKEQQEQQKRNSVNAREVVEGRGSIISTTHTNPNHNHNHLDTNPSVVFPIPRRSETHNVREGSVFQSKGIPANNESPLLAAAIPATNTYTDNAPRPSRGSIFEIEGNVEVDVEKARASLRAEVGAGGLVIVVRKPSEVGNKPETLEQVQDWMWNEAVVVHSTYIAKSAHMPVNISAACKTQICDTMDRWASVDDIVVTVEELVAVFNQAEHQIYKLMETDSYPRYLRSVQRSGLKMNPQPRNSHIPENRSTNNKGDGGGGGSGGSGDKVEASIGKAETSKADSSNNPYGNSHHASKRPTGSRASIRPSQNSQLKPTTPPIAN